VSSAEEGPPWPPARTCAVTKVARRRRKYFFREVWNFIFFGGICWGVETF